MAFVTQVDTSTLSNQSIVTALLVHTYTNTTRVRKLWIDVHLDQVAGNGDYIAHITKQLAGAGSFYESIKTTKAAAAGITSVMFNSIPIIANATDVIRVYVIGLAGDTTTVDIITQVREEWQDIDANGRVDVGEWLGSVPAALSTNGYVQAMLLRWLTDNAAGTPDALSTNKIPADIKLWLTAAPAALTASGYVQAMLLRWLTDNAAGTPTALATNRVPADPTAVAIADQVWDELIAGHVAAGSTGKTLSDAAAGAGTTTLNAEITELHVSS